MTIFLYLSETKFEGMVLNFRQFDNKQGLSYIDVPLSEAAIKFYLVRYGKGKKGIHMTQYGAFGGLLKMFSEKQPYRQGVLKRKLPGKKLRFWLCDAYAHCTIREEMIVAMSEHLNSWFRQMFISFVDGAMARGSSRHSAVICFLEIYGINDDDWNCDSAEKCHRDWSEKVVMPIQLGLFA